MLSQEDKIKKELIAKGFERAKSHWEEFAQTHNSYGLKLYELEHENKCMACESTVGKENLKTVAYYESADGVHNFHMCKTCWDLSMEVLAFCKRNWTE